MAAISRLLIIGWLFTQLTACAEDESYKGFIDRQVFGRFGITLFASPMVVSMKEIHLDGSAVAGRQVVVEGKIVEIGAHGTFVVVSDESARMMIVLTQMPTPIWFTDSHKGITVRILGTFDTGRRGLPLVYARAIRFNPGGSTRPSVAAMRKDTN